MMMRYSAFVQHRPSGRRPLPFPQLAQLIYDLDITSTPSFLPGNPRIRLDDERRLNEFLVSDLDLGHLDPPSGRLRSRLEQDGGNGDGKISTLHHQRVRGRSIVVTEDSRLHLVLDRDRIYIKPLPRYLLSATFWQIFLLHDDSRGDGGRDVGVDRARLYAAAAGLLRTYASMVRHESDFRIAVNDDLQLIPKDVSWEQFCIFASHLERLPATAVSQRYAVGELESSYVNPDAGPSASASASASASSAAGETAAADGELRTRHNARPIHCRWIVLTLAIVIVFMNAMQIELACEGLLPGQWHWFLLVSRFSSVVAMIAVAAVALGLFAVQCLNLFRTRMLVAQIRTDDAREDVEMV